MNSRWYWTITLLVLLMLAAAVVVYAFPDAAGLLVDAPIFQQGECVTSGCTL